MQIHDNLNTMDNMVMVRPSQHYSKLLVAVCLHSSEVLPLPPPSLLLTHTHKKIKKKEKKSY